MRPEQEPPAINWDMVLFKKLADVEAVAKTFEENIPEPFKTYFKKEPENIQYFIVLLSLLSNEERERLKDDLKAGKAKNHVLTGHNLGNCITLYEIFSGKILPKDSVFI